MKIVKRMLITLFLITLICWQKATRLLVTFMSCATSRILSAPLGSTWTTMQRCYYSRCSPISQTNYVIFRQI